jgi:integrase
MKLTDDMIAAAVIEPGKKMRVLSDGHSLKLYVTPLSKYWRLRHGKKEHGLGYYRAVSIEQARAAAAEIRAAVHKAPLPVAIPAIVAAAVASAPVGGPTFGVVADHWLTFDDGKAQSKNTLYKRRLYAGYLAALNPYPIGRVTPAQVRTALEEILGGHGIATAHRAATYASNIFDHAQRYDVFHNPASRRKAWLPAVNETHHEAITDPDQFGHMMEQVDLWESSFGPTTSNAVRFLARTVVRRSELAEAQWSEFRDLDKPELARWEIPAERMKAKRPHIVPLAPQAVAILEAQRAARPQSPYCFPHRDRDRSPMEGDNLLRVFDFLGYKGRQTAHGLRTCFSTIAREAGQDDGVIELCLAHADRNKVRAAYNRAERLEERRALMCWWAGEIERLKVSYQHG